MVVKMKLKTVKIDVQKLTDKFVKEVDEIGKVKEKDIMTCIIIRSCFLFLGSFFILYVLCYNQS